MCTTTNTFLRWWLLCDRRELAGACQLSRRSNRGFEGLNRQCNRGNMKSTRQRQKKENKAGTKPAHIGLIGVEATTPKKSYTTILLDWNSEHLSENSWKHFTKSSIFAYRCVQSSLTAHQLPLWGIFSEGVFCSVFSKEKSIDIPLATEVTRSLFCG